MVEARQMKDAVQSQDFHFFNRRVSEPGGIFSGDVGGDGDITGKFFLVVAFGNWRRRGKGKHVGGFVFAPELPIQRAQNLTASHENIRRIA